MAPVLLITRPEPAARRFADAARARLGDEVTVMIAPMMRIVPCGDLPDMAGTAALIFTSRNGVAAFAMRGDGRKPACFAVGDATAEAARAAGFTVRSAGGTVDDLARLIRQSGEQGPFLHLRGAHAAGELCAGLRAAGLPAREAVIYRQEARPLGPRARAILDGQHPVIVPLFSPRSARLFFAAGPYRAPLFAVAISKAVAREIPPGAVLAHATAGRPDAQAVLDELVAIMPAAKRLEGGKRAQ